MEIKLTKGTTTGGISFAVVVSIVIFMLNQGWRPAWLSEHLRLKDTVEIMQAEERCQKCLRICERSGGTNCYDVCTGECGRR